MGHSFTPPPFWNWPTLGDYRAIDTFVPPGMVDLTDPQRLVAEAVELGFHLDEDITPQDIDKIDPDLADQIILEAATTLQQGRMLQALDPEISYAAKSPDQQEIWEAVIKAGRPLYLLANLLVDFFDTDSFMPVIRIQREGKSETWNVGIGLDAAELGMPDVAWKFTHSVGLVLPRCLKSATTWMKNRTRDEYHRRTIQFKEKAQEKLSRSWAEAGLCDEIEAVPLFSDSFDPQFEGGFLAELDRGEEDIRYGLRKIGSRSYLGIFEFPAGRRQPLAAEQDLPLAHGVDLRPAPNTGGVTGWSFHFPFYAENEWWAKISVWAMAEAWSPESTPSR